ncbi:PREDICTED: probable E3 ubiquitin-protein ligase ARI10 [Prunus mume]|uniref:RBR-type E3 ubiquitin transferase n=1 Tax=Prunus mume TaxID=102107 RepID=A0ABM1LZ26_PRUMU|nr:PREDICTED: probable E3 ubiquitin-protein ligase ARI10 [Prunus mume]
MSLKETCLICLKETPIAQMFPIVNIETCEKFLSPKLANIMIQRIKECSIPATEKVYCAFPRCSALMKCMKCHQLFCINCKVPWHYDMNCYDYQSLAMKKLWRQCSKCKHMVELDSGCCHVTCRCGHQFCYTCGAEWKSRTCSRVLQDAQYCIAPLYAYKSEFLDNLDTRIRSLSHGPQRILDKLNNNGRE